MKKKKFILILLGAIFLLIATSPFTFSSDTGGTNIDWVCIGKPSCVSVLTSCNFQPISLIKTKQRFLLRILYILGNSHIIYFYVHHL